MKKNQRNKEGSRDGYWEERWNNGHLYTKGNYIDGKEEGYWEVYHDNGKLNAKGNYIKHIPEGYWEYYHYSSEKYLIEYYVV
jgi:antitoxin component YwqK of YwqJK toxin-antitoxin module